MNRNDMPVSREPERQEFGFVWSWLDLDEGTLMPRIAWIAGLGMNRAMAGEVKMRLLRVGRELLVRLNWRRRARMRLAKEFRDIVMAKAYDLHERAERNGAKEIGIPPDTPWSIEDFIWWMRGLCTFHERAVLAGKNPKLAAAEWASKMPPELRAATCICTVMKGSSSTRRIDGSAKTRCHVNTSRPTFRGVTGRRSGEETGRRRRPTYGAGSARPENRHGSRPSCAGVAGASGPLAASLIDALTRPIFEPVTDPRGDCRSGARRSGFGRPPLRHRRASQPDRAPVSSRPGAFDRPGARAGPR